MSELIRQYNLQNVKILDARPPVVIAPTPQPTTENPYSSIEGGSSTMTLPGIIQTQALLANARVNIDAAEQILIAPTVVVSDVVRAQFKIIDAAASLEKALIAVENSEDAADAN